MKHAAKVQYAKKSPGQLGDMPGRCNFFFNSVRNQVVGFWEARCSFWRIAADVGHGTLLVLSLLVTFS